MNGNASRRTDRPKHNYRLAFRSIYGAGRLEYPVFGENAATDTFNQLVIRGFNGDAWTHPNPDVFTFATYIRDQWYRDSLRAMGYPEVLQREAHVYFNGLYWGVHHIFERIEAEWAAERFGGDEEDWGRLPHCERHQYRDYRRHPRGRGRQDARKLADRPRRRSKGRPRHCRGVHGSRSIYGLRHPELPRGNGDWDQNNVRVMRRINRPASSSGSATTRSVLASPP